MADAQDGKQTGYDALRAPLEALAEDENLVMTYISEERERLKALEQQGNNVEADLRELAEIEAKTTAKTNEGIDKLSRIEKAMNNLPASQFVGQKPTARALVSAAGGTSPFSAFMGDTDPQMAGVSASDDATPNDPTPTKNAKAKKPQEPNKPVVDPEAEEAEEELNAANLAKSKFATNLRLGKHIALFNDRWGVPSLDPALVEAIEKATIEENKKTKGFTIVLPNGHKIDWVPEAQGIGEFIGMMGKHAPMDEQDAHVIIAAGKSKGWSSVKVHGSAQDKELLWLEAQRQGLQVSNFAPPLNSPIRALWEAEQAEIKAAVTDGSKPDPVPPAPAKPEAPAKPVDKLSDRLQMLIDNAKTPDDAEAVKKIKADYDAGKIDINDRSRIALGASNDKASHGAMMDILKPLGYDLPAYDAFKASPAAAAGPAVSAPKNGVPAPALAAPKA